MKIGILTYHFSNNYGAVLQTYALMEQLRIMGHQPVIVDRTPIKTDLIHRLYQVLNSNSSIFWEKFRRFQMEFLRPKTESFYTDIAVIEQIDSYNFDAIIVGSDQIWRNTMCGHSYFLNFLPEDSTVRRISYAASFGTSEWNMNRPDTEIIKKLLHRFNDISVREYSGQKICKDIFGVEANIVLDPTMLHDSLFYQNRLLNGIPNEPSGRVVSYILGKGALSMVKAANNFAEKHGMAHHELYWLSKDLKDLHLANAITQSRHIRVEEWLNEIRDAEYIVTNSFHCAVFSILFRKPFVVIEYESGGNDRLHTLTHLLGIENKFVSLDNMEEGLKAHVNYDIVMLKLQSLREDSINYLTNALTI